MGTHPLAAHEERCGYALGPQKAENFHVAARGDRIQLAQVKGKCNYLGPVSHGNPANGAHICGRQGGQHCGGFALCGRGGVVGQGLAGILRVWLPRGRPAPVGCGCAWLCAGNRLHNCPKTQNRHPQGTHPAHACCYLEHDYLLCRSGGFSGFMQKNNYFWPIKDCLRHTFSCQAVLYP